MSPFLRRLGTPAEPHGAFPLDQVHTAAGNIRSDVGWRDYRLVEQSDRLAVFNPVFDNRESLSRGVLNEINFATGNGKPVYIFQDPRHDERGCFRDWLANQGGGTMGETPTTRFIVTADSVEELLELAATG